MSFRGGRAASESYFQVGGVCLFVCFCLRVFCTVLLFFVLAVSTVKLKCILQ